MDDLKKKAYMKEYLKRYRQIPANKERQREYQREYQKWYKDTDARKETLKRYKQNDICKEYKIKFSKLYRKKHPDRARAMSALGHAVNRDGKIVKPDTCELCGKKPKKATIGHHSDYSKPLDVMWLCERCHKAWHKNNVPKEGVTP